MATQSKNTKSRRTKRTAAPPAGGMGTHAQTLITSLRKAGETDETIAKLLRNEAGLLLDSARILEPATTVLVPGTDPDVALRLLKDHVVRATDLIGESLASVEGMKERDYFDPDGIRDNLSAVHLALWEIRWECYSSLDDVQPKQEGGAS